ncbi:MAG: ABC transporter substrate-binding protein [Candidatus Acidiferrales bacterium]|jgi:hypothetical protein
MLSRRLAAISAALGMVLGVPFIGAGRAEPSRRPRYGGTLRVEIGAVVNSLDPAVTPGNEEEAAAKEEIETLLYERRSADGSFAGTAGSGPFRIAEWESGKHLTLAANEGCSGGRPFVDSVEIQMGRAVKDRLLDLELDRMDFAEIPAEEARRAAERGIRVSMSEPDDVVAIVFVAGRPAAEDARVREALARSLDRAAMVNFILQKQGEPAGGLLPQWSSGTAFLFSPAADVSGAKELVAQIGRSAQIVLGYDSGDSLEQSLAERIVVDAREAGLRVAAQALAQGTAAATGRDARLMRLRMRSPHPHAALGGFIAALAPVAGLDAAPLAEGASAEEIYERERAIVSGYRVVPLVWLPQAYGLGARVRDWKAPSAGEGWPLADIWLEQESP